jgi:hypothetical protein
MPGVQLLGFALNIFFIAIPAGFLVEWLVSSDLKPVGKRRGLPACATDKKQWRRCNMPQDEKDDLIQHEEHGWGDGWVPEPPTVGWRLLTFVDDTQVRVKGLDEILAYLYAEGKPVDEKTVEEIIGMLEAEKNYIPSSDRVRREYAYVLLKEYRKYVKSRADKSPKPESDPR